MATSTPTTCVKVSNRKYAYDTKKATENGLVELGRQMTKDYNKQETYEQRYIYLSGIIKEIDDFSIISFMAEHERCHDENIKTAMVYSMLKNIGTQKELIECLEFLKKNLEKKQIELQTEIVDSNDMIESYLKQLDDSDKRYETIKTELIKTQHQLKKTNINMTMLDNNYIISINQNKYYKFIYLFLFLIILLSKIIDMNLIRLW